MTGSTVRSQSSNSSPDELARHVPIVEENARPAERPGRRQDTSYIRSRSFSDSAESLGFLQWTLPPAFAGTRSATTAERGNHMNAETTTQNPFPTTSDAGSGSNGSGLNGDANRVRRMAQSLHEAVDSLEQKFGTGSERIMGLQEEYGNMARDQVRANPLAALGAAFAAGFIIAKILR
jgi:hypothetical protein